MRVKQNQIQNAIRLNTQLRPQTAQFWATIELTKQVDEGSPKISADHITIFANSKSQRVDFPGISNEYFPEMSEQMILSLKNFSSHGRGWSIKQIKNI